MTAHERRDGVRLGMARLPLLGTAPKAARELVETVGRSWGLSDETVYAARLAVSELVTNALIHADGMPGGTVTINLARADHLLAVEVHDASRAAPQIRYPTETAESGRGLILVSEVTDGHGHYLTPFGKAVWFTLKSDWPLDVAR